jgi:nucleoside-diphosphate-sugar epimerase
MREKLVPISKKVTRLDRNGNVPEDVTNVFDFAAYGNIHSQTDEAEIYKVNVDRVVKLLQEAQGKHSVVLTSSSSVLLPTQTSYSESKSMMENIAKEWVGLTGEPVVVARPSTVTGVGDNKEHLIPKLIRSAKTGEEMDFVGEPVHDYIDVDDYVDAVLLLARVANRYRGHIFNVSFGLSVSNEVIKELVAAAVGTQPNVKRVENMRAYDTKDWRVPNHKLRALGWRPKKSVDVSIKEMVAAYK